jgi:hypothetical protein
MAASLLRKHLRATDALTHFGLISDIALLLKWAQPRTFNHSFDHFVSNSHHARWDGEAQRLGDLEVDHKFVFGTLKRTR